jgi:hypothetical protein
MGNLHRADPEKGTGTSRTRSQAPLPDRLLTDRSQMNAPRSRRPGANDRFYNPEFRLQWCLQGRRFDFTHTRRAGPSDRGGSVPGRPACASVRAPGPNDGLSVGDQPQSPAPYTVYASSVRATPNKRRPGKHCRRLVRASWFGRVRDLQLGEWAGPLAREEHHPTCGFAIEKQDVPYDLGEGGTIGQDARRASILALQAAEIVLVRGR